MDKGPKVRFGVAPASAARSAEEAHDAAGSRVSMRIEGGRSARMSEAEEKAAEKRPYGVNMQARTGEPCTMEDLMAAEAAARYGQAPKGPQYGKTSEEMASHSVRREAFRPLPAPDELSAAAGTALNAAGPASTNGGTQAASRSPYQTLRSLFSRAPGTEKRDSN